MAISTGYQDSTFLWGYAQDRIYSDKPSTLESLKTNICQDAVKKWSKITFTFETTKWITRYMNERHKWKSQKIKKKKKHLNKIQYNIRVEAVK